jgi:hypothetical protein
MIALDTHRARRLPRDSPLRISPELLQIQYGKEAAYTTDPQHLAAFINTCFDAPGRQGRSNVMLLIERSRNFYELKLPSSLRLEDI